VAGRAELLARSGQLADARAAYRTALELPTNAGTRRRLAARLAELGERRGGHAGRRWTRRKRGRTGVALDSAAPEENAATPAA